MKHKKKCKCKHNKMKTYLNGGVGQGRRAVVHKGELIINNPFKRVMGIAPQLLKRRP